MEDFKKMVLGDNRETTNYFYVKGDIKNYTFNNCSNLSLDLSKGVKEVVKKAMRKGGAKKETNVLQTEEAKVIWEKLYRAGIVDKRKQPKKSLSLADKGTLADCIAERLKLETIPWKEFGLLWNESPKVLKSACERGHDQAKTWAFRDKIMDIIK